MWRDFKASDLFPEGGNSSLTGRLGEAARSLREGVTASGALKNIDHARCVGCMLLGERTVASPGSLV